MCACGKQKKLSSWLHNFYIIWVQNMHPPFTILVTEIMYSFTLNNLHSSWIIRVKWFHIKFMLRFISTCNVSKNRITILVPLFPHHKIWRARPELHRSAEWSPRQNTPHPQWPTLGVSRPRQIPSLTRGDTSWKTDILLHITMFQWIHL